MNITTQQDVCKSAEPIYRSVRVDHLYIHYKKLKGGWYTNTLISKVKSVLGNTVANLYTQGKFVKVYHITPQREAG